MYILKNTVTYELECNYCSKIVFYVLYTMTNHNAVLLIFNLINQNCKQ